jgi:alpha-acetolactate decarboxylase
MAKRPQLKVGDKVTFRFAGMPESGKIALIEPCGEVQVFDGKYYYRREQNLVTKIKDNEI